MPDVITLSKESLRKHEGFRSKVYQCTAGRNTIGIGRNLDDKGITEREAEFLLDNDIVECIQDLATFSYWNNLSEHQKAALIDLRFNLGPTRYRGFIKMNKALDMGDYTEAAYQVLNSNYAKQVGRRAENIAEWLQK